MRSYQLLQINNQAFASIPLVKLHRDVAFLLSRYNEFNEKTKDIEKFLFVAREREASDEFQCLKKLLSVKEKIEIFKGITSHELKALVYDVRFKRYKLKKQIIKEGDESSEIFFLLKGECHTFIEKKLVGEIGVVTHSKRGASVFAAVEEVLLLAFKTDEENLDFNARALAIFYKNLASAINDKLHKLNIEVIKK